MSGGVAYAVRLGLRRGWTEFGQSVRSPQDQAFYVFMGVATLAYLWFNREDEVEGTSLLYPTVALPSILAALVAFNVVMGPASALVMEREDGTLLRYRSLPHGLQGYVSGQVLHHSLGLLPTLVVILVPSALLFDGVMPGGVAGWLTAVWVLLLGMAATMPLGMVLGAVMLNVQKLICWGMLPALQHTLVAWVFFSVKSFTVDLT